MTRIEGFYRRLLCLYSKRFRDLYGEDMVKLFRERMERARADGTAKLTRTAMSSFMDLFWSAALERSSARRRRRLSGQRGPRLDWFPVRIVGRFRGAVRSLYRQPMLVLTVVFTLTLGTGATLTLFAIADAAILRPLPYPEPDELILIAQDDAKFGLVPFGPPYLGDLRQRSTSFDIVAGFSPSWTLTLTGLEEPRFVVGAYISDRLLELVGVGIVAGRTFDERDHLRGAPAVALVTEAFWERHFGLDASFTPSDVRLDDKLVTIVGVVPSSIRLPITTSFVSQQTDPADVFLPWSANPYFESRTIPVMNVVARLRDGVSLDAAAAELHSVGETFAIDFPETSRAEVTGISLRDRVTRGSRRTIWTLFGAASFLLLIACANVANLLLSKSASRRGELAIRWSLGARRWQVAAEILSETLLLALAGVMGGLVVARFLVESLSVLGVAGLPPSAVIGIDLRVFLFAAVLIGATCVASGLVPALHAARDAPGTTRSTRPDARTRAVLVGGEIALAIFLLVGAGLLARSFWNLVHVDPGFRAEGLLQAPLDLSASSYDPARRRRFADELVRRVSSIQDVSSAAMVNRLPLSGSNVFVGVDVEGVSSDARPAVDRRVVTPGYFRTMGIPIVDGRDFASSDRVDTSRVAVVNETLARRIWPEGALGRRVRLQLRSGPGPWLTVVGVCGDVHHHGLDTSAEPELYVPYEQSPVESAILVLRTQTDLDALVPFVGEHLWALDDGMPLDGIGDVASIVHESVSEPRLRMLLLNGVAALALALSAIGIYGVTAYSVSSQTREIGLRIALGAGARGVVQLIVGRGMRIAVWGVVVGLVGALGLSRLLRGFLFGVAPDDWVTFAFASLLLLGVAILASYVPAARASRIDPMEALRLE